LSSAGAFVRLVGAGWTLVRHDALLPRELEALYPPWLNSIARALRLFARRDARVGRPGERLAWSLERLGRWRSSWASCSPRAPICSAAPSPRTCRG